MLETLTQMDWPAAAAIVGLSWAVAIPLVVRRSMKKQERIQELHLKRAIQLEQFKKGGLTYIEEHG